MMVQKATVVEIKENQTAVVEVSRSSACGDCGESCMTCPQKGKVLRVEVKNTVGAQRGDAVELISSSGRILGLAFLVYILPLIVGVAAYLLAAAWGLPEKPAVLAALLGFVAAFVPAILLNRRAAKNGAAGYYTLRRCGDDSSGQ